MELYRWFSDPQHRVAIVVGPTGSGKSTALPYWLVNPPQGVPEDFFTRDGKIVVTQPRILAAQRIGKYLGADLIGSLGDVGIRTSQDKKADWRNVIQFCTDGILINDIVKGKLNQYSLILLDEAHERSINIDKILMLLKARLALYPKLRLIIASATIKAESFRDFFGTETAAIVEFEGKERVDEHGKPVTYERMFASEDEALPYDDLAKLKRELVPAVVDKVMWILTGIKENRMKHGKGDILVFLQGVAPIDNTVEKLRDQIKSDEKLANIVDVRPLYRDLSEHDKDLAINPPQKGKIKVIVSTNIAEASVTIDGLVYEIETGVENIAAFNRPTGVTNLGLSLISKANAIQRWGRTGRTKNGEVYCLYTDTQFTNLFADQPSTAITRSNMGQPLLDAKTAGIPDPFHGWLENPPETEAVAAFSELSETGAIAQDGTLTDYGLLLRSFSYPGKLVDLLLLADDLGCAVEVATILPVIKNGGERRLMQWNYGWNVYTKRDAFQVQRALQAGSLDDVEFILKLVKAWENLPWLQRGSYSIDEDQKGKFSLKEKEALRENWAYEQFVNSEALETIISERDEILGQLYIHKKDVDAKYRPIDLSLVDRVRMLLYLMLPEISIIRQGETYTFQPKPEALPNTVVTCTVYKPNVLKDGALPAGNPSWMDLAGKYVPITEAMKKEERNTGILGRLFIDQVYPLGSRFNAKILTPISPDYVIVGRISKVTSAKRYEEILDIPDASDPDASHPEIVVTPENVEGSKKESTKKTLEPLLLSDQVVAYDRIAHAIVVHTNNGQVTAGGTALLRVAGYTINTDGVPMVITQVVPQPEPIDVFRSTYKADEDVAVEVTDVLTYPNDRRAALVVKESVSKLEILVEPSDLSFEVSSWPVLQIPVGTRLTMKIASIHRETWRVSLTMLPFVEKLLTTNFLADKQDVKVLTGKVVDLRPDKFIVALDWSKPAEGLTILVPVFERKLPGGKNILDYSLEQPVSLKIARSSKNDAKAELQNLPKKAQQFITPHAPEKGLYWVDGNLFYAGHMSYDDVVTYKRYAADANYHKALERLFWLNNRLTVMRVMDEQLASLMSETYPVGSRWEGCIVLETSRDGATIQLDGTVRGFAPRSKVLDGKKPPDELLIVGHTVSVTVLEIRQDREELLVSVDAFPDDPFNTLVAGDVIDNAIVESKTELGVFVRVAPGVTGLMGVRQMNAAMQYNTGDTVKVRIFKIEKDRRRISLDQAY